MPPTKNTTDICYVISHGFAARMILQTGLVERLAAAGKSVAIITPDAADDNLVALKKNPLITVYNSDIKLTIWDDDYGVKRRYYLEDIRAEGSYLKDVKATQLLEEINPKLVVSTYPINYLESKFLYAAKEAKIATLIHLLSWDNITSRDGWI